jgi:hypothetical protein
MAVKKAIGPHRSTHSTVASLRKAANEVERMKISQCRPVGSASNAIAALADGAPPQALLDAVEDQRVSLLNVLDIVHCMSASFVDAAGDIAPEISAAFALLEQEIQRVVAGLEEVSLRDGL